MSSLNVGSIITSVGVQLPVYTNSSRPTTVPVGFMIFNSEIGDVEIYGSTGWKPVGKGALGTEFSITTVLQGGSGVGSYDLSNGPVTFQTSGYYVMQASTSMKVKVQMWGAGGGGGSSSTPNYGSAGGYTEGILNLDAGNYTFIVGKYGEGLGTGKVGGYPDGGNGGTSGANAAAGGGSTRFGPEVAESNKNTSSTEYYLIAGGGGGGCNWAYTSEVNATDGGGEGGGTTGGRGSYHYVNYENLYTLGLGGTQTAGGAGGGTYNSSVVGRLGNGDSGAKYDGGNGTGGGGGGGYYGGGGARGYYSSGGGGSGYVSNTSVVESGTSYRGGTGFGNQYYEAGAPGGVSVPSGVANGGSNSGGNGGSGAIIFSDAQ
jgi:hypothetical protein